MPKRICLTVLLLAVLAVLGCDQEQIDQLSVAVGVDPQAQLTPTAGRNVTTDQTITGEHIAGQVTVNADVTITDSVIEAGLYGIKVESGSLTVERVDILGASNDTCAAGIYGANWSAANVEIMGCEDGAKPQGNVTMSGVFIHTLDVSGDAHADAVQIRSGTNITIRDSVLIAPWRASNAVLQINPVVGPIQAVIEDNVLSGGNYIVNGGGSPDVTLTGNTLEADSTTNPKTGDQANNGFIVNVELDHYGNVWSDNTPAD